MQQTSPLNKQGKCWVTLWEYVTASTWMSSVWLIHFMCTNVCILQLLTASSRPHQRAVLPRTEAGPNWTVTPTKWQLSFTKTQLSSAIRRDFRPSLQLPLETLLATSKANSWTVNIEPTSHRRGRWTSAYLIIGRITAAAIARVPKWKCFWGRHRLIHHLLTHIHINLKNQQQGP